MALLWKINYYVFTLAKVQNYVDMGYVQWLIPIRGDAAGVELR